MAARYTWQGLKGIRSGISRGSERAVLLVLLLVGAPAFGDALPKKLAELEQKKVTPRELPKKLAERAEKKPAVPPTRERAARLQARVRKPIEQVIVLRNRWTKESFVLEARAGALPDMAHWNHFVRCHFTGEDRQMSPEVVAIVVKAALHFRQYRVDVISGFRHPKYNLILRKKGRGVAKDSQHTQGNALDFRLRGVAVRTLFQFVKKQRVGGVGYYPYSGFVHADAGPVRYWTGH